MSTNLRIMPLEAVNRPVPNFEGIRGTLSFLLSLSPVVEIRGLGVTTAAYKKPHIEYGYFDDLDAAAKSAFTLSRAEGNVYVLLNPVNSALLARAKNRTKMAERGANTSDNDILRRQLLLVDCDPERPSGISATDTEKEAAGERAATIRRYLAGLGWPAPAFADSGNGYHLLYRIDLANDAESAGLVRSVLQALDTHFGDAAVKVDTSVFNAARIVKLYGTVARKGDHTSDRPHRTSALLEVPQQPLEVVSGEVLRQIASTLPREQPPATGAPGKDKALDMERWIAEHNLESKRVKPWQGGKLIVLDCPFNPDHHDTFHVAQFPSGAISAGCLHRSCAGKDWHALRDYCEPGWHERRQLSTDELQTYLAKIAADPGAAFAPEFIETAAALQLEDEPAWARLHVVLRQDKRIQWDRLKKKIGQAAAAQQAARRRESQRAQAEQQTETGMIVPAGYRLTDDATLCVSQGTNGDERESVVAHSPLSITARMRDVEENCEFLRIQFKRAGQLRSEVIDRAVALDARKLISLAGTGFPVASDNVGEVVSYLRHAEAANDMRLPCYDVASRFGWQGRGGVRGFLVGSTLIGHDGFVHQPTSIEDLVGGAGPGAAVVFRGAAAGDEQAARSYRAEGTLEGWMNAIRLIEPYPKVLIAFYAGFVAPLQDVINAPNFIVNWSCETSKGKTSSLRVAGSIYGNPDERADDTVIGSWKATAVHIERSCSIRSGLPVLLDETKHAPDRRDVGRVLYAVANGTGKGRGNTKGIALTRRFRTIMLSTGEAPATSFSQDGGTRTRCIEITRSAVRRR